MAHSRLSTTGLGILGLLAVRPFSAYELAQQLHRGPRYLQPASERNLYAEPKRLAAAGLVRTHHQQLGRRRRTIYAITPAGRQALRRQLATPPAPPQLEFEALQFSTDFLVLVRDWVALARREVASWPTTRDLGLTHGTRQILEDLLQLADQPPKARPGNQPA